MPVLDHELIRRHGTILEVDGEELPGRIALNVIAVLCVLIIGVLFGIRISHVSIRNVFSLGAVRLLVFGVYLTALLLIFSLVVNVDAFDISFKTACRATIANCYVFYLLNKGCLYFFFVERVHAARSSHVTRRQDWVWVKGMGFILLGFIIVAVLGFTFPYSHVSDASVCLIGFGRADIFLIWAADMFINIGLTSIFVSLLWPTLKFRRRQRQTLVTSGLSMDFPATDSHPVKDNSTSETLSRPESSTTITQPPTKRLPPPTDLLEKLLQKTLIGTIGQLLPTLGNMIVILVHGGHEPATTCLTLCCVEVTIQVVIIHWLTNTLDSEPGGQR